MPQMKPQSPTEAEAIGLKHLVSLVDKSGCSALHIAAIYGNRHCVRALLAAGARLEAEDDEGQTPLLSAVSFGHSDVVELLLAEVGYSELRLEFSNVYHRVQMLQRGTGWEKQVVVVNAGGIMTCDAICFSSLGLYRAASNGDYLTAIMLMKSAAAQNVGFEVLCGKFVDHNLERVFEVFSCHASASFTTTAGYMAFFRSSFARFSPLHQSATALPFHFKAASESSDSAPVCLSDDARWRDSALKRLDLLQASLYPPISASAQRSNWIQTQIPHMSSSFPTDCRPRTLPGSSLYHSFLLRVFRNKGKAVSRSAVGWTTLTITPGRRHRTVALCLSSVFSFLAMRLCMQSTLSSSSSTAWQQPVLSRACVSYLRFLRNRCHSQVRRAKFSMKLQCTSCSCSDSLQLETFLSKILCRCVTRHRALQTSWSRTRRARYLLACGRRVM